MNEIFNRQICELSDMRATREAAGETPKLKAILCKDDNLFLK
jgi:hypothetical protein